MAVPEDKSDMILSASSMMETQIPEKQQTALSDFEIYPDVNSQPQPIESWGKILNSPIPEVSEENKELYPELNDENKELYIVSGNDPDARIDIESAETIEEVDQAKFLAMEQIDKAKSDAVKEIN